MTEQDQSKRRILGIKSKTLTIAKNSAPSIGEKSHKTENRVVIVTKKSSLPAGTKVAEDSGPEAISAQEKKRLLALLQEANKPAPEPIEQPLPDNEPKPETNLAASESESLAEQVAEEARVEEQPEAQPEKQKSSLDLKSLRSLNKIPALQVRRPSKAAAPIVEELPLPKPALEESKPAPSKKSTGQEEAPARKPALVNDKQGRNKLSVSKIAALVDIEDREEDGNVGATRKVRGLKARKDKSRGKAARALEEPKDKVIREIALPETITVQELASRMAEKAGKVIKFLMGLGINATINQPLDIDTAELVVGEFGHTAKRITEEETVKELLQSQRKEKTELRLRPPVVTVMGHVDHGKTSLLDALRSTDVASHEHGGITQHIGAYQVQLDAEHAITFLDTPGHESFTALRLRGAKLTDIVILVVAADDGVMEQTVEALNHAKAAQVPIIVAINKIDKPGARVEAVKNSLFQYGLIPDDMGGDTMVIGVSAKEKIGLKQLEEAILLQAELLQLQADYAGTAEGYVIEAKLDKGKGIVASLLVKSGNLKVGDIVVAGQSAGKVKAIFNDKGKPISAAPPASPIEILGLENLPTAGDSFIVVQDEKVAKELISIKQRQERNKQLIASQDRSIQQLFSRVQTNAKELSIILKSDTHGSDEAILHSLKKIEHPEVMIKILHHGIGSINESDVSLAAASKAIILGFNTRPNANAKEMLHKYGVQFRQYAIIYDLIDDVKGIVSGLLSPIVTENITGTAQVRQVFDVSRVGKIAGCYVTDGVVKRNLGVRLIRNGVVIYQGKLSSLKRHKDDAKEVKSGFECGISLEGFEDIKVGDLIEAFETVSEKQKL